jgi:2-methylisocitrate lyase-like PEP mutase family enzyme
VLARPDLSFAEITDAGAQRVSVGGALTWVAVSAMATAAGRILEAGDFSALGARPPLERWLGAGPPSA